MSKRLAEKRKRAFQRREPLMSQPMPIPMPPPRNRSVPRPTQTMKTMFPSNHPNVQNPDGSVSNVRTMTVEMDGKHYVLPSMVEGKQLTGAQAVGYAKAMGLSRYPWFQTGEEALRFSQESHGMQPAPQILFPRDPPPQ